jgi:hypothetical protein
MNAEKNGNNIIEVAGTDLDFRSVPLKSDSPTGRQVAKAAGFATDQNPYVYQWREDGDLEEVRPTEEVDLENGKRFIVAISDRVYRLTIDGDQFDWPARRISGAVLRKLGRVPDDKELRLERSGNADKVIGDEDVVDLDHAGVESFISRKASWKLNVQGVTIVSETPTISVTEALTKAGFNASQPWIIIFKVKGEPKRQLSVNDNVDLRTPGIEKIRLTPKEVNNGEARTALRRDFALLDVDENHLDDIGAVWETVEAGGYRWLIIHGYPVPPGFNVAAVSLALMVPPMYPQAQIDMFYVNPPMRLAGGGQIAATEAAESVKGVSYQRWSRHRGEASPWNPACDNVITHLGLVESAIAKEVGQ